MNYNLETSFDDDDDFCIEDDLLTIFSKTVENSAVNEALFEKYYPSAYISSSPSSCF